MERLTPEKAVQILYEGKMRYLSGSGKRGAGVERWLNPYVLVNKENLIDHKGERALLNIDFQNYYFATLFAVTGGAYYLNTANRTPAQSLEDAQGNNSRAFLAGPAFRPPCLPNQANRRSLGEMCRRDT